MGCPVVSLSTDWSANRIEPLTRLYRVVSWMYRSEVHDVRIGSENLALSNMSRRDELASRHDVAAFD
jgi:hypothetical protein